MAKETYKAAQSRLFAEFRDLGCTVKDQLVVPQVELPNGETLMFKSQAVHLKSNSLSTWLDIRNMSAQELAWRSVKCYFSCTTAEIKRLSSLPGTAQYPIG